MNTRAATRTVLLCLALTGASTAADPLSSVSRHPANTPRAMTLELASALAFRDAEPISSGATFDPDPPAMKEERTIAGGLFVAAVFPGAIIHGSGNLYAGSRGSAVAMVVAEIAGLASMAGGFVAGSDDLFGDDPGTDTEDYLFWGGVSLFLGSWAADIVSTPFLVKAYNERISNPA